MASMEDLIATISGGLHAGQQGNDLKDLHAKLAQTINPNAPHAHYRPIPPPSSSSTAVVPPAPASSWNTPPPSNTYLFASPSKPSPSKQFSISPSQQQQQQQQRQNGFSVPMPNSRPIHSSYQGRREQDIEEEQLNGDNRPYHAAVLPVRASPKDTGGFAEDAFKPLWESKDKGQWKGFKQNGA